MKKTILFIVMSILLTGCASTGPILPFGHKLNQDWIQADFDGEKGNESISRSNLADIVFNNKGEIIGWYVKNYAGSPYIKENENGSYDFSALQNERGINNLVSNRLGLQINAKDFDNKTTYIAKEPILSINQDDNTKTAIFEYTQNNVNIKKTIIIHNRNFLINVKTEINGLDEYEINIPGLGQVGNPKVKAAPNVGQTAFAEGSGTTSVENIKYAAIQQEPPNQISLAILVKPVNTQTNVVMNSGNNANLNLLVNGTSNFDIYGGKNELIHLHQAGFAKMPNVFQPNWFGQISLLLVVLMNAIYKLVHDWGIVIIVLTILVRIIMWPIMQAQAKTTAKMQIIQPRVREIQEKYKDKRDLESQMQMQTEIKELYAEHNFNPSGCLAAFLPLPILITLWSTMRNFEFDSGFLWMPDLAIPDPLWILPILYLATNIGQLWVSTRRTPEMFKQQAFMYIFLGYFALIFPSSVSIYLILSTAIGIIQQIIVNKQVEVQGISNTSINKVTEERKKNTKIIDSKDDK